jgi:hypothetical protein
MQAAGGRHIFRRNEAKAGQARWPFSTVVRDLFWTWSAEILVPNKLVQRAEGALFGNGMYRESVF